MIRFKVKCMGKSAYVTNNILQKTRPEIYYKTEKMQWNQMVVPKEELKDTLTQNTHCYLEVANLREKKVFLWWWESPSSFP